MNEILEEDEKMDEVMEVHEEKVDQCTSSQLVFPNTRKFVDIGPGTQPIVWYYTQQEAFDNYVSGQRVITADTKMNQQNKKYCVLPIDKIEQLIQMTPKHCRNFYEMAVITGPLEFPVKLFYDFDLSGQNLSIEEKQEILKKIRNGTIATFEKHFNVSLSQKCFVEMDSSYANKTSLHAIVCGYHFKNIEVLKRLMKTYLKTVFDYVKLDEGMYSKNRSFRMLGCCKYGRTACLELMTDHCFNDSLITFIDDSSTLLHVSEDIKVPKAPRRSNFEIQVLNLIIDMLAKKFNDTMQRTINTELFSFQDSW